MKVKVSEEEAIAIEEDTREQHANEKWESERIKLRDVVHTQRYSLKTFIKAYTSDLISELLPEGQACPTSSAHGHGITITYYYYYYYYYYY